MGTIDDKLKGLLGERYIAGNADEVSKFFRDSVSSPALAVAYPKTHDEVHEVVKASNDAGSAVFTNYGEYLPQEIAGNSGVIIDYKEMSEIERLDAKNLMAHIQCGMTFDNFQNELKKENLKVQTPVGVRNDSVVKNFINRCTIKSASKYPGEQITNVYVTLADGRLHKSGSHAINEMTCDTNDGAAFLSKWYSGSRDIYGVISRGSVLVYPIWEKRDVIAYDFDNIDGLLQAMRDVPRAEIGIEYVGMDDVYLKSLTGESGAKFTLVVGFDGFTKYVDWQEKTARELIEKIGGKENNKLSEVFLGIIDNAWAAQGAYCSEFAILFNKVKQFDEVISGEAGKNGIDVGRLYVSMDRGRSVACLYEYLKDDAGTEKFADDLDFKLLDMGAVFDVPEGDLSKAVFDKITGYSALLKRVKDMVDPKGILNPGIIKI